MKEQKTSITAIENYQGRDVLDVFVPCDAERHEAILSLFLECFSIASLVMRLVILIRDLRDEMLQHALLLHLRLAISRTPSHTGVLHGASRNVLFCTLII